MSKNKSSSAELLSDRYASALYSLATEEKCIEKVISDLEKIMKYNIENKDFYLLLQNPLISSNDKKMILNYIFEKNNAHTIIIKFLETLSKNKRFSILINIINRVNEIEDEKKGSVKTEITSAKNLDNIQKDKIYKQLQSKLGQKLSVKYNVDESIIGGLIIKYGSTMIDSSLINKINKIKLAMKEA